MHSQLRRNSIFSVIILSLALNGVFLFASGSGESPAGSLAGTKWTLLSLDGKDLMPGTSATIDFTGKEVSGSGIL